MSDQGQVLCRPSNRRVFGEARSEALAPGEWDDVLQHLSTHDMGMGTVYLVAPDQVRMGPDGATGAGVRYSVSCLRQVCRRLSTRLYGLLFDAAAGTNDNRSRAKASLESAAGEGVPVAAGIFNAMADHYFHRLEGRVLTENQLGQVYDSLADKETRCFHLAPMVETVASMAAAAGWSVYHVFVEDRFVSVLMGSEDKLEGHEGHTYVLGGRVEINAPWRDSSVAGFRTILRVDDGIFCAAPVPVPPLRKFDALRAVAGVMQNTLSPTWHARIFDEADQRMAYCTKAPLGLKAGGSGESPVDGASLRRVAQFLGRNDVQQRHAKDVVQSAAVWGGDELYSGGDQLASPLAVEGRTWYDLAAALMRHADKFLGPQSDKLRDMAMQILLGRVNMEEFT